MCESKNVIVEHGSFYSRCGFAGEDLPKFIYRTTNIHAKNQFNEVFRRLKLDLTDYNIVVIKDTGVDHAILKSEADTLFTDFAIKGLAFSNAQTAILFSWAHGYNGIIIDIGYNSTIAVPIAIGNIYKDGVKSSLTAGKSIETYILRDLQNRGLEPELLNRNKEQIIPILMQSYYYFDCQEDDIEFQELKKRKQNLQDTLKIEDTIHGTTQIPLPDPLLPENLLTERPSSTGLSLVDCLVQAINENLTATLELIPKYGGKYGRVIFCGGGGQVLGLRSLLIRESLKNTELLKIKTDPSIVRTNFRVSSNSVDLRLVPPDHGSASSWVGNSIIFSLKFAQDFFVSKQNYLNTGTLPSIDDKLARQIEKEVTNSDPYYY